MGKFKKPAGGNRNGEDDDAGTGLFFLLSLLTCIVLPWTLAVIWKLLTPGKNEIAKAFPTTTESGQRVRHSQTAAMASKRDDHLKYWKSRRRLFTSGFTCRLVILVLLWCWIIYIMVQIQTVMATSALYSNFEPFEILGISSGSSNADIKKQFRSMSRKLHPDRNPSPNAAEEFMLVKKAYDCLTDPIAKSNFERYGNPDGPTRMDMGVALPTFKGQNQGLVLLLFVFGFVLGIPILAIVLMNCGGERSKNSRGVQLETEEMVQRSLSQKSFDEMSALDLLAQCRETCSTNGDSSSPDELQAVAELWKEFGSSKKKHETADASQLKGEMLLRAHLQRRPDLLTLPSLQTDLEGLLPQWRLVSQEMAVQARSTDSFIAAVRMERCVIQGLDVKKSANDGANQLLQAPHLSAERVKSWRKGPRKTAGLLTLLELPADTRRSSLKEVGFEENELLDIEDFVTVVPRLKLVEAKVFTDAVEPDPEDGEVSGSKGKDEIFAGDYATLKLILDRQNLREDEAAGTIHCPLFPKPVHEAWYVLFKFPKKDGKEQWRIKRIENMSKLVEFEMRFPVDKQGKNRCKVQIISEVYDGIDLEEQVSFEAKAPPEPPSDDDHRDEDDSGEYEYSD